ncbi:xaa-Pro aminopeptidase ApepP-like isoform X2 [Mytilus trossulus]|uniref:xaa-Pro aminopeptidase ApepP-like isoform X2 n=1 Tax=Mytilus trossulus TaxID=6551 RepID=UPI0030068806
MWNVKMLFCILYLTVLQKVAECALTKEQIRNMSPSTRPSCQPGAEASAQQVDTTQRLSDLRSHFQSNGINGYIIPSVDAHQSEYVSEYDKRRQFISGFSGSQATAVVLENKAALWTDGRYFLQAEDELDCNWILMKGRSGTETVPSITEWVIAELEGQNGVLGAYPFLIGSDDWIKKDKKLVENNMKLARVEEDLIDKIWTTGRPVQPNTDIHGMKLTFTGKSWLDKFRDIKQEMEEKNVNALVVTSLDEVAWLSNCRASDVPYNPVFMSYAIVNRQANTIRLYIREKNTKLLKSRDPEMSTDDLFDHLNIGRDGNCANRKDGNKICFEVFDYNDILDGVRELNSTVDKIWISYGCSYAIYGLIDKDKIYQANTPIALMKSVKNPVEQMGLKKSHIRDAVALITFMAKLEKQVQEGEFWTEMSAASDLQRHRRKQDLNRGLSFETISSSGYHGAVIHYAPSNKTDKQITTSEMYLLDSGGQYLDGTTDVTRTFHFGSPTDYEKECYTLVLKGHIALTQFVFTTGLKGRELDALARRPLWKFGLQYLHGTGHGIGSYLNVHEGPGRISIYAGESPTDAALQKNMFFSVEPGYYEDGKFGVRHENIAQIVKAETKYHFKDIEFLTFNTVTMVPYEPHLIDYSLLTKDQVEWINSYHKKVQSTIGPLIKNDPLASKWLSSRTGFVDMVSNGIHLTASTVLITVMASFLYIYL